ncbi:MAG: hypothetical protein LBT06_10800 [Hungatella sp.]|jgi:hypothetical protein|nr:hypothetical protein [Hungatella sp.]
MIKILKMNSNLKTVLIFAAGAGFGSLITRYVMKSRYGGQIIEAGVIDEGWDDEPRDPTDTDNPYIEWEEGLTPEILEQQIREGGFMAEVNEGIIADAVAECDEPYEITEDEYQEDMGYRAINLMLWSDGYLTEDFELFEDPDYYVGDHNLIPFIQNDDIDMLFVRNPRLAIEYEVIKDTRNYRDVLATKPYLRTKLEDLNSDE